MIKAGGVILVLAGVCAGIFAHLSSQVIGLVSLRQSPVNGGAPAPAQEGIVEVVTVAPSADAANIPPKALSVAEASKRVTVGQQKPSSRLAFDGARLTREIQLQLRRVGCYHGHIDDVWSPTVRRAMKAFTDRVNARLPVEHPDIILLAMLQNHQGEACGMRCWTDQTLTADARCPPSTLITNAAPGATVDGSRATDHKKDGVGAMPKGSGDYAREMARQDYLAVKRQTAELSAWEREKVRQRQAAEERRRAETRALEQENARQRYLARAR